MVILIRHGETVWNKEGKRQGNKNSDLTEKGIMQAHKIAKFIKTTYTCDFKIYSSPLGRAKQTTLILSKELGLLPSNIQYDNKLKELSFGIIEGKKEEEIKNLYSHILEERELNKWEYNKHGFESYSNGYKRAKEFIQNNIIENQCIIIISHESFFKLFLGVYFQLMNQEIFALKHSNNIIKIIENNKLKEITID